MSATATHEHLRCLQGGGSFAHGVALQLAAPMAPPPVRTSEPGVRLTLRMFERDLYEHVFPPHAPLSELCALVERETDMPPHEQRLSCRGVPLTDLSQAVVAHHALVDGDVVEVEHHRPPRLYVLGGWADEAPLNSAECFDLSSNIWSPLPSMGARRFGFSAAVLDGLLYVVGGSDGFRPTASAVVFDSRASIWHPLPPMGIQRTGLTVTALEGGLYAVGGNDGRQSLASTEVFDPKRHAWSLGPSMIGRRGIHGAALLDGVLYVAGGADDDGTHECMHHELCPHHESSPSAALDTAELLELTTGRWRVLPLMHKRRAALTCAVVSDVLFTVGGHDGRSAVLGIECYDPTLGVWSVLPEMSCARVDCAVVALSGSLYAIGGHDEDELRGAVHDTVESFELGRGTWLPLTPLQVKRCSHATCSYDGKIYVLGGHSRASSMNVGEVYNPAQDSWSPLPSMIARRDGPTVVPMV